MLNGLDLFSGIGGLSIALKDWVRPVSYCEIDPYCQAVLLSRIALGKIPNAPIWDDVRSLRGRVFPVTIDVIYGGFPCQDISVAGRGKGLEGERSGLFFEIVRLAKEIKPPFIFLENVPAITSRGGLAVVRQITQMGYDCRWCVISAASIGALHRRERWFLLAYSKHSRSHGTQERGSTQTPIHPCEEGQNKASELKGVDSSSVLASESIPNSGSSGRRKDVPSAHGNEEENGRKDVFQSIGLCSDVPDSRCRKERSQEEPEWTRDHTTGRYRYWETEPSVGRMVDGVPNRVDRSRGLGNAVVPQQAKEAFEILMGLK